MHSPVCGRTACRALSIKVNSCSNLSSLRIWYRPYLNGKMNPRQFESRLYSGLSCRTLNIDFYVIELWLEQARRECFKVQVLTGGEEPLQLPNVQSEYKLLVCFVIIFWAVLQSICSSSVGENECNKHHILQSSIHFENVITLAPYNIYFIHHFYSFLLTSLTTFFVQLHQF